MPYIVNKVKSQEITLDGKSNIIISNDDNQKDFELTTTYGKGMTYEKVSQIKESFSHLKFLDEVNYLNDSERAKQINEIKNIDEFYESIWERTLLELMFITQYYTSLISDVNSFEKFVKTGDKFEYWFNNNVRYVMLEQMKKFYIRTCEVYAEVSTIDIYEKDVEQKAKEVVSKIEKMHVLEVQKTLEEKWNKTYEEYKKWNKKQEEKRKTILFD